MSLATKINQRFRRDASRLFACRPARIVPSPAVVSFTFDDFPRSALLVGGQVLARFDCVGTYYASLGLMGKTGPTGEIFQPADLQRLVDEGHELGCHTFDHCHAWDTPPAEFAASIRRNRQAVAELLPAVTLTSFSYPISCPRPRTKLQTAQYYDSARGGGQTYNAGNADLNLLQAFFIEQSRDNFAAIQHAIDANNRAPGWLIFATHDVSDSPTNFGCTPRLFEQVVGYAAKSGATVLPVAQAWHQIQSQSGCHSHSCHCP